MSQLKVNSIVPSGGLPAGSDGGGIIQCVQTVKTDAFSTTANSTWTDITGMSASITPQSSSNKILVHVKLEVSDSSAEIQVYRLLRGGSVISASTAGSSENGFAMIDTDAYTSGIRSTDACITCFLDAPSTTSSTTYKVQVWKNAAGTMWLNRRSLNAGVGLVSMITLMEVSG
jgi:hypothetical protein